MNFKKYTKKVGLTVGEKEKIRGVILQFISQNKFVRNDSIIRHKYWRERNIFLLILNSKPMIASLIAAVLIAFSGGAAAAAENTVPGDLLYPVKLKINEEVRSILSLNPEAKIAWDTRRAERRLEETEKLAKANKLTTSTAVMLAEKFKDFSEKANARLEKLQSNGQLTDEQIEKLKENFEVSIKAHEEALSRIQERTEEKTKLKAIIDSVRDQASSTIRERVEKEIKLMEENSTSTLKIVAENRKNAANNKISEVENFINQSTEKVSAENKAEALNKLTIAKNDILEGDKLYNEEKYGEAIIKYSEAHRDAQEAKKYLTGHFRLEAKINTTSTVASGTIQTSTPNNINRENMRILEQRIRGEIQELKDSLRLNRANGK